MDSDQLIKEQFKKLPNPVKEAIASFDWSREVFDIGKSSGLHVDDIGALETEVGLVIIGLVTPQEFEDDLVKNTSLKDEQLSDVVDEINDKVFSKIRKYLKEYYEKHETEEKEKDVIEKDEFKIMKNAGVNLGLEDDEEEATEKVIFTPPKEEIKEKKTPVNIDFQKTIASKTPDPKPVGKTDGEKISETKEKVTSGSGFDPYREPIE